MAVVDIIVEQKFGSAKQVSMAYVRNVACAKLKHISVSDLGREEESIKVHNGQHQSLLLSISYHK